jgi:hypothetical protein
MLLYFSRLLFSSSFILIENQHLQRIEQVKSNIMPSYGNKQAQVY